MLKTYTVRDPDNPDILLDVEVLEEKKDEEKDEYEPIGYKREIYDQDQDELKDVESDEPIIPKNFKYTPKEQENITKIVAENGKRRLFQYRHVYRFICTFASQLGLYDIQRLLKNKEKPWEEQIVSQTADGIVYETFENSAELLELILNGIYYGALLNAYNSIAVFRTRGIKLEYVIDSMRDIHPDNSTSDPKIAIMFVRYAVTMFKAGTVAGFSAQPGRVYTGTGSVALNIHAGTQHRQEIQQQLNLFTIWFNKIQIKQFYKDGKITAYNLSIFDLRGGGGDLSGFAQTQLRRMGAGPESQTIVKDEKGKEEEDDDSGVAVIKKQKF